MPDTPKALQPMTDPSEFKAGWEAGYDAKQESFEDGWNVGYAQGIQDARKEQLGRSPYNAWIPYALTDAYDGGGDVSASRRTAMLAVDKVGKDSFLVFDSSSDTSGGAVNKNSQGWNGYSYATGQDESYPSSKAAINALLRECGATPGTEVEYTDETTGATKKWKVAGTSATLSHMTKTAALKFVKNAHGKLVAYGTNEIPGAYGPVAYVIETTGRNEWEVSIYPVISTGSSFEMDGTKFEPVVTVDASRLIDSYSDDKKAIVIAVANEFESNGGSLYQAANKVYQDMGL